jgi:hypothetical protein
VVVDGTGFPFIVKLPVIVVGPSKLGVAALNDPVAFMSPSVVIEATTWSLEFLNSTKLGVAPFSGYKNRRLRRNAKFWC